LITPQPSARLRILSNSPWTMRGHSPGRSCSRAGTLPCRLSGVSSGLSFQVSRGVMPLVSACGPLYHTLPTAMVKAIAVVQRTPFLRDTGLYEAVIGTLILYILATLRTEVLAASACTCIAGALFCRSHCLVMTRLTLWGYAHERLTVTLHGPYHHHYYYHRRNHGPYPPFLHRVSLHRYREWVL